MTASFGLLVVLLLTGFATGCAPGPTDDELTAMCEHLAELRKEAPDEARAKQCIADAKRDGTTPKQARCRATAANLQEYWVRCRTGEAHRR